MLPTEQLNSLLEIIKEKDRETTLEIQLITARIRKHRTIRSHCFKAPSLAHVRMKLRSWRKISYRLHQRRSEFKNKLENIQMHLRTVGQKIEETETDFLCFQAFLDTGLEPELASAGA